MAEAVYREFSQTQLDYEYNARAQTPEFQTYLDRWAADSEAVRRAVPYEADVAYGASAAETLDIFRAEGDGPAPVQIFFHGGYWRSLDKSDFSYLARAFPRRGAALVVVNYGLCPSVDLDELVRQCRAAVAWTYRHIGEFGGDPSRIFLSGHSAGAHLAAMAAATDWSTFAGLPPDIVKGATALSGLYELEPVRLCFVNEDVRLTPEQVGRNSPVRIAPPRAGLPVIVAPGTLESGEFRRQSSIYADFLRGAGCDCDDQEAEGHNHFSIMDAFEDDRHPLGRAVMRQMGLG